MMMRNQQKVFLLTPKIKKDEFREIIIWSKDEDTARKNSRNTSMAAPKGTSQPFTIDDLIFYEDSSNSTCTQLDIQIEKENDKIYFEYNKKHYELIEDDPEQV